MTSSLTGSTNTAADEISEAQRNYAASDVLYLHQLKEALDKMLEREGRTHLAQAAFDFLPMRAELGGDAKVYATGGMAGTLAEALHGIEAVAPHLTLEGLRLIHRKNRP